MYNRSTVPDTLHCFFTLLLLLCSTSAMAEEGGGGHAAPGSVATLIDAAPSSPGWVVEPIFVHYEGDFDVSRTLPIGGIVSVGLDAKVDTLTLGALYTFADKVWGAYYSAGIFVPLTWMDIKGNVNNTNVRDKERGIADITLVPAMFAWKNNAWQYTASLSIYAPTGDYKADSLANLGLNYWTLEPVVGAAYSNEATGFNFGIYTGITFNSENSATDYKSGSMFHIEGSIQQLFPFGDGFAGIGLDAFYFEQLSADSGSGAIRDFKGRTVGIGPVINYILPMGSDSLVLEAKWLPESNTVNRLKGDYFWAKVVYQFQ